MPTGAKDAVIVINSVKAPGDQLPFTWQADLATALRRYSRTLDVTGDIQELVNDEVRLPLHVITYMHYWTSHRSIETN